MNLQSGKIIELLEELYLLDDIQEGAIPIVSVDDKAKTVDIDQVYISHHYDAYEEVPSAFSIAEKIIHLVKERFETYQVSVSIFNYHGVKETFNDSAMVD